MKKREKKSQCMDWGELMHRMNRHWIEMICDIAEFESDNDNFFKDVCIDGKTYRSLIVLSDYGEDIIDENGKIRGFAVDDLLNRRINKLAKNQGNDIYAYPRGSDCAMFIDEYFW